MENLEIWWELNTPLDSFRRLPSQAGMCRPRLAPVAVLLDFSSHPVSSSSLHRWWPPPLLIKLLFPGQVVSLLRKVKNIFSSVQTTFPPFNL